MQVINGGIEHLHFKHLFWFLLLSVSPSLRFSSPNLHDWLSLALDCDSMTSSFEAIKKLKIKMNYYLFTIP